MVSRKCGEAADWENGLLHVESDPRPKPEMRRCTGRTIQHSKGPKRAGKLQLMTEPPDREP